MAVGVYGTKKLADIDFNDVDILYSYSSDRVSIGGTQMTPLYDTISNNEFKKMFGSDGMYKLRLPSSIFNQIGFYSIIIKPKSFKVTILDCSIIVSANDNDIQISKKGIVIPKIQLQGNGSLIGYQLEYFSKTTGTKNKGVHKIITSSDLVKQSTANNTSQYSSKTYYLSSDGDFLFLTLSPDETNLISSSQDANLGTIGQDILISNTSFDPVSIEIEIVDQDIKTLSYALYGNSTRDLSTGIYSIFDENGNLFKQYNLGIRKSTFSNGNIEFKENRTDLNLNQSYLTLSQGL